MKEEYLEYAVLLEKAIAGFYEQLKKQDKLGRIKQVLEFMETHSMEHAERLSEASRSLSKPALGDSMIMDYQNFVTRKVYEQVDQEHDLLKILQALADSEEKLGDLYNTISDVMGQLSSHYTHVAEKFREIARDEYRHRDLLLADKKRLEQKK